jgi:cell division protein FtsA
MLVDVGGLATNWAVYRKGAILASGTVALGGGHLTGDLSHGLRITREEAEQVKRTRGVVLRSLVDQVPIEVLFDERRPAETPGLVAAILEPRMEEIFTWVKNDFGDPRELALLKAGVVLTGGGSRCRGTRGLCEEVLDLQVRRSFTPAALKGTASLPEGQWATALGLSLWYAGGDEYAAPRDEGGGRSGWLERLRGRFRRTETRGEMAAEA